MKLQAPPKPTATVEKIETTQKIETIQNGEKKQQPQVNYFIIFGAIASIQSSMMQPSGSLTGMFKLFTGLGGAACCIIGIKQEMDKQKQKK